VALDEMCNALLPVEGKDPAFTKTQRDWLKAIVFHVKTLPGGNMPMVFDLLSESQDELLAILGKSESRFAAAFARKNPPGKVSYLVEQEYVGCGRQLNFFGYDSVRNAVSHSDFSAHDLGKNGPIAVFLQFNETKLDAMGALMSFFCTSILSILIDNSEKREPVAIFLDELGNMPPLPGLVSKMNTVRSRGIPIWVYLQSTEQIESRYSENNSSGKNKFIGACSVKIVFRLDDNDSRNYFSEQIGLTQKMEYSSSKSAGVTTSSKSWHDKNVIEPYQLGRLPPGRAVCLYKGASALVEATPHYKDFPGFKRK
jgi:type IV secretion system protein VirD4